jgi:deazaflavin-dependent oxidoreductase (nitroreductase family)
MRKIAKTLLPILGVVVVFEVVDTALHVWAWRSRSPRVRHLITRYNKCVTNRLMLPFSGRSGSSAIVHHIGRRSGRPYATPVIAHQTGRDVIIPLPYGTDVDWLRNLLAAGEAVVDLEGRSLGVDEPAVVDIDDVIGLLPASMVRTVRFTGARDAVRMRATGSLDPAAA